MPIWHAYHCGSAFSISQTRLFRSLEWLVVTLTICCRVHIFDTFSCGNKAVLILPRGQDRPFLPDRVANRIRSNFLPRGASRTIYYNYRIIKEATGRKNWGEGKKIVVKNTHKKSTFINLDTFSYRNIQRLHVVCYFHSVVQYKITSKIAL